MIGVIERELAANHSHASQVSAKRWVLHGGLVPKVNHSCDPNCGVHLNSSGAHDFVARGAIMAGQEITFDYAMRNYTVQHFAAHCRCGSRHCRDSITGWKDLSAQRKADYRGFVAPYLTELDAQQAAGTVTLRPGAPERVASRKLGMIFNPPRWSMLRGGYAVRIDSVSGSAASVMGGGISAIAGGLPFENGAVRTWCSPE